MSDDNHDVRNLPSVKISLDTSTDDLAAELYSPCLRWADRYDRGVGYFTTGWLKNNLLGLSDFASRGGKIRLITSPIISEKDYEAIICADNNDSEFSALQEALNKSVDSLAQEMSKDFYNTFAWMIHDGIIELKFAIPKEKLDDGNFHDKFGIFYRGEDALSFSGSINDSVQGFRNYESIKVFKSWAGTGEYVDADIERFKKIWEKADKNLSIYTIPEGVKKHIFSLRTSDERPYKSRNKKANKWEHQDIAVEKFMDSCNGILAMATGTGKTITAIKIINRLFDENKIKRVVISMAGNDLLDQWAGQIRDSFKNKPVYRQYSTYKEMMRFVLNPDDAFLLTSSEADNLSKLLVSLERMPGDFYNNTLFVFDEVHGMGSSTRVENLSGKLSLYKYRLGLSATPEREYDEEGNSFIEEEIGPVIYKFGLKDAIEKHILCEFDYIPLMYDLTEEESAKKKKIIASFNAKKKKGEPVSENEMYTQLSLINKTASLKLNSFEALLEKKPDILESCIIFVQTMEYGERVQDILLKYITDYHTYYADDQKENLEDFSQGRLNCLLTCKKVSEGIDISRVKNIVLFSSDRSKLVTTQRIGRALRLDKNNPDKVANVVDFIMASNSDDETADEERCDWLIELSKIRRIDNEKQDT